MATGPLIAIVGQTASGKSGLAMQVAQKWGGEIIAADSRTVYKGMNIGTAKPTAAERAAVRHHLIDVVEPSQPFSAADFQRLTKQALADIQARHQLPIIVGGTGLYVDAVLYDFQFRPPADPAMRSSLEKLSVTQLQQMIIDQKLPLPNNAQNRRHLVRTLETQGQISTATALRPNTCLVGLKLDHKILQQRIVQRVEDMVAQGFVTEVRRLFEQYGFDTVALQAPGYKAFRDYIKGQISLEEAKAAFVRNDLHLAKRQRTWFQRNPDIRWFSSAGEAFAAINHFLNNQQ